MLNHTKKRLVKKIELVPLIDVIFLLLIFFLVTLNIIPVISKKEMQESEFAMPVVTAEDASRIDMFIQIHQFEQGETDQVHYFTIDGELSIIPISPTVWDDIIKLSQHSNGLTQLQRYFRQHYFESARDINYSGKKQVIISAGPWISYEDLFEVIQECVNRGITYHCIVGSFADLPQRIDYSPPTEIVKRYEW